MPLHVTPLTAQQIAANQQIQWHFYMICGIELAGIFLAVVVLRLTHYPDYILSGIALIVAVHFFPLAALFKNHLFYGTALVGCASDSPDFPSATRSFAKKLWDYLSVSCSGRPPPGRYGRDSPFPEFSEPPDVTAGAVTGLAPVSPPSDSGHPTKPAACSRRDVPESRYRH